MEERVLLFSGMVRKRQNRWAEFGITSEIDAPQINIQYMIYDIQTFDDFSPVLNMVIYHRSAGHGRSAHTQHTSGTHGVSAPEVD